MGCKDINNVPRDNLIFIRKSRFLKKRMGTPLKTAPSLITEIDTEKEIHIAVEEEEEESTKSILEPNKSKKLKFKKKSVHDVSNPIEERYINKSLTEPELNVHFSKTSKRPSKVLSYGSDKVGYSFIAFKDDDIPKKEVSIESDIEDDHSIEFDSNFDDNTKITFTKYISVWSEIESGVLYDMFPLPVKSDLITDINNSNILDFLKTKEIIKKERLRWHPDKMKAVLDNIHMWDPENEKVVTEVFQTINSLYETM